jgi:hypothetical protein
VHDEESFEVGESAERGFIDDEGWTYPLGGCEADPEDCFSIDSNDLPDRDSFTSVEGFMEWITGKESYLESTGPGRYTGQVVEDREYFESGKELRREYTVGVFHDGKVDRTTLDVIHMQIHNYNRGLRRRVA